MDRWNIVSVAGDDQRFVHRMRKSVGNELGADVDIGFLFLVHLSLFARNWGTDVSGADSGQSLSQVRWDVELLVPSSRFVDVIERLAFPL